MNIWNSLPNDVVEVDVDTINIFKNRLDKYWTNQEVFLMILTLTLPELEIYQFVSECMMVKMRA